jgi:hypothetical protein
MRVSVKLSSVAGSQFIVAIATVIAVVEILVAGMRWFCVRKGEAA